MSCLETAAEDLRTVCTEFDEVIDFVGGRVSGPIRSGLTRKLQHELSKKFPGLPQDTDTDVSLSE